MAPKPAEKGIIETIKEYFRISGKEPKKTPATFTDRLNNIAVNNFRGLVGTIVAIAVLVPLWRKTDSARKLLMMWIWMSWFYLIQPVAVPNTSLIPVFFLPMGGVLDTGNTCAFYMNETIMLFVLTSWAIVMFNNSGVDKRIALWFVASGDTSQYSGSKLVWKTSSAAFFLSMFSSRLLATLNLTELVTKACEKIDSGGGVRNIRDVVNNAIQTSAAIGSTAILHSSYVNLLARGCFNAFVQKRMAWQDIFNYFTYSAFAFPVAFIMFIVNIIYHMVLVGKVSKGFSELQKKGLQTSFQKNKDELPTFSLHELYTVIFHIMLLVVLFFRWVPILGEDFGWANFSVRVPTLPSLLDATVLAIFIILLHTIPKSFSFTKIFTAKKKSELEMKPESAVLWWRFVDKNCNYGYLYTFGAAFAICTTSRTVGLDSEISSTFSSLTDLDYRIGILIAVAVAAILCNLMTSLAACSVWLPFMFCLSIDSPAPWPTKVYLNALGVGIASNFGFCTPFQFTPAYYCHRYGKVPIMTMIKYSVIPVVYCTIILFLALNLGAEMIWEDSSREGFQPIKIPTTLDPYKPTKTTTTTT